MTLQVFPGPENPKMTNKLYNIGLSVTINMRMTKSKCIPFFSEFYMSGRCFSRPAFSQNMGRNLIIT